MREADRRKDEFLALLSHELRNPLAPILTAAQLMQLRGDVATPREREVIIRQAPAPRAPGRRPARRLARGARQGRRSRSSRSSSRRVVAKAVESTAPLARGAAPPAASSRSRRRALPIEADEVRLTQVVSNLLTNAARYTPPGGRIDVTAAREGDEVVLRVRDNGIGIDADAAAARVRDVRAGRARRRPLAGRTRPRAVAGAHADRAARRHRQRRTATGRAAAASSRCGCRRRRRAARRRPRSPARAAARRSPASSRSACWSSTTTATPPR